MTPHPTGIDAARGREPRETAGADTDWDNDAAAHLSPAWRDAEALSLLQLERLGHWTVAGVPLGHGRPLTELVGTSDGLTEVVRALRHDVRESDDEELQAYSLKLERREGPPTPLESLTRRIGLTRLEAALLRVCWVLSASTGVRRLARAVWPELDPDAPSVEFLSALLAEPTEAPDSVALALRESGPLRRLALLEAGAQRRTVVVPESVATWLSMGQVPRRSPELREAQDSAVGPELLLTGASILQLQDALQASPPRLVLIGQSEHALVALAHGLASRQGASLLTVGPDRFRRDAGRAPERLTELFRDALLASAWVLLDFGPAEPAPALIEALTERLPSVSTPVIIAIESRAPWLRAHFDGIPMVEVPRLPPEALARVYRAAAPSTPTPLPRREVLEVFADYRVSATTALTVAKDAAQRATSEGAEAVGADHLRDACRHQVAVTLSGLATRLDVGFTFDDLVLPPATADQVREVRLAQTHRAQVMNRWGFSRKYPYGAGLTVLFSGPSGTGKTMAACVIARELERDIYRVDLSQVFDRYIGETEKNLARIFDGASSGDIVLLFDEADALFSKRTEVKSSNDRYANLEVNYLLQRMESYPGIAILTTNLDSSIDDAFRRRIRHSVRFPEPDDAQRERLWRSMMTAEADVDPTIDWAALAAAFELSGGGIKNAVLRAAFLAAGEQEPIGFDHLWRAGVAECAAAGRLVRRERPRDPRQGGAMTGLDVRPTAGTAPRTVGGPGR